MAYTVMAYIVMAYIVMAYLKKALRVYLRAAGDAARRGRDRLHTVHPDGASALVLAGILVIGILVIGILGMAY